MKPGRNDLCPCGSGKKYKKCCSKKFETPAAPATAANSNAPSVAEMGQLVALYDAGQYVEQERGTRLLLDRYPDCGFAWKVLAVSLQKQGKDALSALQRGTELLPHDAELHSNLGVSLRDLGQLDDAMTCYRRALAINPAYADAHNNLGTALQTSGQFDDAVASFRRALAIKPDFANAHSNLILCMDLSEQADSLAQQAERMKWDQTHAAPLWKAPVHTNDRATTRRLRVGYVSGDFREHSAPSAFGGMLTQFDRAHFDVYAYSNFSGKDDRVTTLFKQNVTAWRAVAHLSDAAVAQLIRDDRIDILVDLSGHSAYNRLLVFAHKPAPIQITAWGCASGTGMRAMDVLFADRVLVPPEERKHFVEQVRYLPCVIGATMNETFPKVNELPAFSSDIISFGSFNRLAKVSQQAYQAWCKILLAVPKSRIILKTVELSDAATRERVLQFFTQEGVDQERVILLGKTSRYEHQQAYNLLDLAVDPFPFGGGVTALEGLMMGVPMVSLRWPTTAGRASASFLTHLGLADWIAETQDQYVALAIQKASDLQALGVLRQQLRGIFTSSVMGDPIAYTRAVEQEYRSLWGEWCANRNEACK